GDDMTVGDCSFSAEPDTTDRPPSNLMVRIATADTSNVADAKAARMSVTCDAPKPPARCDLIGGDITRPKIRVRDTPCPLNVRREGDADRVIPLGRPGQGSARRPLPRPHRSRR